jgi:hypothetical protein
VVGRRELVVRRRDEGGVSVVSAGRPLTLSPQTATWAVLGLVAGTLALVTVAAAVLPPGVDWQQTFAPSSQDLVRGQSPYGHGFYNPPWALVPLLPFAADEVTGRAALFLLALLVVSLVVVQLGGSPVSLGLVLISPPVVHSLLNANLEWLALAGLLLPPRWGLFLVVIKPQVGAGVAVWWAAEAWREHHWKGVWDLAWPVSGAFLGSLILFGLWPLNARVTTTLWWNASFWPWSVPVGLILLGGACGSGRCCPRWLPRHFCRPTCCSTPGAGRWSRWCAVRRCWPSWWACCG